MLREKLRDISWWEMVRNVIFIRGKGMKELK
jgi:hypothetical protein